MSAWWSGHSLGPQSFVGILTLPIMVLSASCSRHGSLPLSMPLLSLHKHDSKVSSFESHQVSLTPFKTIQDITPVEYAAVLVFTSKSRIEIKAKSDYFPDTREVEIMSSSPIHETIIAWLHKCFITFSSQISHNDQYIDTQFFTNNRLPDKESLQQVPDIMGVVHCVNQFGNDESFVRWLVEAGFSQSDTSIMHKFGNMVKNNSDIKKLIRVLIDEDGTFQGPEEHTEVAKSLCKSGVRMNCEKFKSLIPSKTADTMYGPVVVGGHNWLKLKAVRITVFLKDEASGKFRFDSRDPEHYAEGTLIPDVDMMSSAVCNTAYFHYVDWYIYKYNNKHKGATNNSTAPTTQVSAGSSQTITLATPLPGGSTTERELRKPKVSKEVTNNVSKKKKTNSKKSRAT
ncbi:uncharacterized protein F5147DRAFT_649829 [Suillus discolor]|uniref:Uncharacterized protein n=1 Tax=Suillus discolor TaxID=1912936 RepID=A0A9P7FES5_9AGAM|nr:uncharacterized protein F5147DRAFT_649829 [Suillus discolor]KAG2114665.1 hypothetical protein F5147DRAFT_649829 [Suillus discolor]